MHHSIYDLTILQGQTSGDVPPQLVGASTTVAGTKVYLFGGQLVGERRMVSDLYTLDIITHQWEKIVPISPRTNTPEGRYFHTAEIWKNNLVIFGGMCRRAKSTNPGELCVLDDIYFFDFSTKCWHPQALDPAQKTDLLPRARYAHLSSITSDRLFIIGGQDLNDAWLNDICVYDLVGRTWVQNRQHVKHCGTYRSIAISSETVVRIPSDEIRASHTSTTLGQPGNRFKALENYPYSPRKSSLAPPLPPLPPLQPPVECTPSESLTHLTYSAPPTETYPSDIYVYSNYNFTNVQRRLEVLSPLPEDFTLQDRSSSMNSNYPPGVRFPTGAVLGRHLIVAGIHLATSGQSFVIWALDLITMQWQRLPLGDTASSGSWFRGCVCVETSQFILFGNKDGQFLDDYNRRSLSWNDIIVVDLDAYGIYSPPPLKLSIRMQELGLAALEEKVLTDFELICEDGKKIPCSRALLEARWPWLKGERLQFQNLAISTARTLPTSPMHTPLPQIATASQNSVDTRLSPRAFHLVEPYPVVLAFLQYLYSLALITPLQHTPTILKQLLMISVSYKIDHLTGLVKHAMHNSLDNRSSVGVYEVSALCGCRSLQIRALGTIMSYTQKSNQKPNPQLPEQTIKTMDEIPGKRATLLAPISPVTVATNHPPAQSPVNSIGSTGSGISTQSLHISVTTSKASALTLTGTSLKTVIEKSQLFGRTALAKGIKASKSTTDLRATTRQKVASEQKWYLKNAESSMFYSHMRM